MQIVPELRSFIVCAAVWNVISRLAVFKIAKQGFHVDWISLYFFWCVCEKLQQHFKVLPLFTDSGFCFNFNNHQFNSDNHTQIWVLKFSLNNAIKKSNSEQTHAYNWSISRGFYIIKNAVKISAFTMSKILFKIALKGSGCWNRTL